MWHIFLVTYHVNCCYYSKLYELTGKEIIMKIRNSSFIVLIASIFLTACQSDNAINEQDLYHHRFIMIEFDSQQVENQAMLEFGESFFISGEICNSFTGQAKLEENRINVIDLRSTDRLCDNEQLNKLEAATYQLLQQGSTLSSYKDSNHFYLVIKNSHHKVTLKLSDLM